MMVFDKGHALVIGVGSHKFHPENDVPITVRDAKAVRDILVDPETCGYPEGQTEFLYENLATTQDIVSALEGLAKRVTGSDTVFIYFAGHGAFGTDDNYYLATHDVRFVNTGGPELKIEAGTGLSQVKLVELLKAIKAEKVLMIFNACHSGSLQPGSLGLDQEKQAAGQSLPDVTAAALLGTGEGRIVISACKPNQLSNFLKTGDLTFFTKALADGLTGKSVPSKGFISAFNLYTYVYDDVTETIKPFGVAQDPMITVLQGVGPFPVARASSSAVGSLGLAAAEEKLPEGAAVRTVTPQESQHWMAKIESQTIVKGDYVEGDKIGQQVNTGGGAFFGGNVTAGGNVVGGDSISVGNISGSSGVAIGRGASATVSGQAPRALSAAQQRMMLLGALSGDEFSEPELMSLAILLGLNYAELEGDDQASKAVSLLKAVESQGNMALLKERVVMFKPDLKDVLG
jgi:hypothetical protein